MEVVVNGDGEGGYTPPNTTSDGHQSGLECIPVLSKFSV